MRFTHLHQQVYHRPWLITPGGWSAVHELLQSKVAGEKLDLSDFLPPRAEFAIENGLAYVPIQGVIGKGLSKVEQSCGACGVEQIHADLGRALADPSARGIFLDIGSPGGTVCGVPEVARAVALANEQKPVIAFVDELMASAAYWIGASAGAIYATESADIGSIGVYLPNWDLSEYYQQMGAKVQLIKAGKLKGIGYPGTSLSDDQREHLQAGVDDIYAMFTGWVTQQRGAVPNEAMQGQTFLARQALQHNLIDGVVSSRTEAENELRRVLDLI
jgi:signal peptide peptidase SppA